MTRPWLPRARPLMGRVSDHEIARRLGIARTIVSKARRQLGITPVRKIHPRGRTWLAKVRPLLGKISDRELARQTGIHFKTIGEARRALGITAAPRGPAPKVGKRAARALAALRRDRGGSAARPAATGPDRSWGPAVRHHLGREPDREVARRANLHPKTVAKVRRELGIPRYREQPKVRGHGKVPLTTLLLASTRSSREISRMTGLTRQTIDRRRRALDAPPDARLATPSDAMMGRACLHRRSKTPPDESWSCGAWEPPPPSSLPLESSTTRPRGGMSDF